MLAAAGEPDVKEKLLHGMKVGSSSYKVHLDGYNLLPYLTAESDRDAPEISRFSCMLFLSVPWFLDYAGPTDQSRSTVASRPVSAVFLDRAIHAAVCRPPGGIVL